jgi:hypothetical protein
MNESQILGLALTVIPMTTIVLIGILINNARLSDTNARVEDAKELLRADVKGVRDVLEAVMEKNHSEMLHRFASLDTRLTRVENGLGMNRG